MGLVVLNRIIQTCFGMVCIQPKHFLPSWGLVVSLYRALLLSTQMWFPGPGLAEIRGSSTGCVQGHARYKVTLFGSKGIAEQNGGGNYVPLVQEIMEFFKSGVPPVSARETVELFAFMEGADISKANGGCKVNIPQLIKSNGGGWLLED